MTTVITFETLSLPDPVVSKWFHTPGALLNIPILYTEDRIETLFFCGRLVEPRFD